MFMSPPSIFLHQSWQEILFLRLAELAPLELKTGDGPQEAMLFPPQRAVNASEIGGPE
jgi:hypothetical protein